MDQYSQTIIFKKCITTTAEPPVYGLVVSNPFGNTVTMNVDYTTEGLTKIQLINQLNSSTEVLQRSTTTASGHYFYEFDTSRIPPGNYTLQVFFNEELYLKNLIKID